MGLRLYTWVGVLMRLLYNMNEIFGVFKKLSYLCSMNIMTYMKRIYIFLLSAMFAVNLWAVPAIPHPISITLADGTTTEVYLHGDEFAHYHTLLNGVPVRIENGQLIEDYTLPEVTRKKIQIARQTAIQASSFPKVGSPRSLVILVNFKDQKFTKTKEDFMALLNENGYRKNGAIGSARDYFIAASDSLFQPIFDVYGPYDLPNNTAFYGANNNMNVQDMIIGACGAAEADGVDFSIYDINNDNQIDNVFVYFAGNNEAEGGPERTVWPHRSYISSRPQFGGKTLYDYACSSEFRLTGKKMCGIGTFCHEFSHVLGLADLYDTTHGKKQPLGTWDLMDSGNYNGSGCQPPSYSAFERFSLGWLEPTVLTDAGQYVLEPLTTHNQAYLIPVHDKEIKPNENGEYFLLENRQKVGWDAGSSCLAGTGMLIWHIDYRSTAWAQNRPNGGDNLLCFIESATGRKLTSGSHADPYPGYLKKTLFEPTAVDGTNLEKPLLDIKQVDKTISFVYIRDGNKHLNFSTKELITLNSSYTAFEDSIELVMPAQKLMLTGGSLDPEAEVTISASNSRFQISLDSLSWSLDLQLTPTLDSTINTPVYIRFRATEEVCDFKEGNIVAQQGAAIAIIELQGRSPRATLITEPQVNGITNLTPYSAELNWDAVKDATHYYVTLYQIEDGETLYSESFEHFDLPETVTQLGWQSNFNTLSSILQSADSYSLWFKETGNQLITEQYLQPITQLSFWYSVATAQVDTIGGLLIEGFDGTNWAVIDSLTLKKHDYKQTFSMDLSSQNYIQFRFTFTSNEGGKGVCIDDYLAVCSTLIHYLYQGDELTIEANDDDQVVTCYFSSLKPNAEYYYNVSVSDKGHGGCEEHIKELQEPQMFKTRIGKEDEHALTYSIEGIQYAKPTHVIYVPEAMGDRTLYFYDMMGQLIASCPVAENQNRVSFPEGNFISGNVYIVKYSVTDSVKRKDRWIKIIY